MRNKLLWIALLLIISEKILSQAGTADNKFGVGGVVMNPDRSHYTNILPLKNGKFILVDYESTTNRYGSFRYSIFWRYNADGTLDRSFGQNGKIRWIFSDAVHHYFTSLILQPDGKILAIDNERNEVWRLDENAKLDPSFGVKGISSLSMPGYPSIHIKSIALDQQNRIVVSGHMSQGSAGAKNRLFIARLNSNGMPDESFNRTGYKIIIELTDLDYDGVFCTTDKADDIIVAVEAGIRQTPGFQSYISKYKSNGKMDLSFGQQGSLNVNAVVFSLLTDQNSKIIFLAGGILKRLNPNGSLDKMIFERPSGSSVSLNTLTLQPDNKIAVTGVVKSNDQKHWNVYVSRFTVDGNVDQSFGTGGSVSPDLTYEARAENIYFYNNRLFVAGYIVNDNFGHGLILAYNAPNVSVSNKTKMKPFPAFPREKVKTREQ